MQLMLAILAVGAFGAVSSLRPYDDEVLADIFGGYFERKGILTMQKFLYDVTLEPLDDKGYKGFINDTLKYDRALFKHFDDDMELFYQYWLKGSIIPKDQIFSLFNRSVMKQTKGLFKLFYYAKDWETFRKIALWARVNVNQEMFVYALNMAVMHRKDMKDLNMPPYEDIFPQYFYSKEFVSRVKSIDYNVWKKEMEHNKQQNKTKKDEGDYKWWERKWHEEEEIRRDRIKASDPDSFEKYMDVKTIMLKADFSEDKLAYLLEDPAWNLYWHYLNMEYPFFMKAEELGLEKERRGESWVYKIQQILARYFQNRLSERMDKIGEFSWEKPIKTDFDSGLSLPNGLGFSMRKDYYNIYSTENYQMKQFVRDYERRMRDSFARGYYMMANGTKVELCKPESFDIIGNLMQGNMDSIDRQFFGNWMVFAHLTASGATLDMYKSARQMLYLGPKIMLHMETAMRHPMFYEMYKHFLSSFDTCKRFMGPYKLEELSFKDIKIKNFFIDELKTFFSWSFSDVSALMTSRYSKLMDTILFARRKRLDHKKFNFELEVESDKALSAVFRVFLGPKYDESGREINLNTNRMNFVELDQFVYQLKPGMNMIKRSSDEFYWYRWDFTTYVELYKMTMYGLETMYGLTAFTFRSFATKIWGDKNREFEYELSMGTFPDRLMLPKGWTEGMPMQMFIVATPADKAYAVFEQQWNYRKGFDKRAFGFPLDREIDELNFWAPNMLMKDVEIFHSDEIKEYRPRTEHICEYVNTR